MHVVLSRTMCLLYTAPVPTVNGTPETDFKIHASKQRHEIERGFKQVAFPESPLHGVSGTSDISKVTLNASRLGKPPSQEPELCRLLYNISEL